MPGRRVPLFLLGAAIGVVFLLLATRHLDWEHFVTHVSDAHLGHIALGVVCLFSYYGVKAERWKHLIAPFARARGSDLKPAVIAGLAGNYLFPHVGQIARALLTAR